MPAGKARSLLCTWHTSASFLPGGGMPDEHPIWLCGCRIDDDPASHNLLLRCAVPTWRLCSFGVLFLLHAAHGELSLPHWHSPTDILSLGRLRIQKHSVCMLAPLRIPCRVERGGCGFKSNPYACLPL